MYSPKFHSVLHEKEKKSKVSSIQQPKFSIVVSEVLLSNCKYYVGLIEFSRGTIHLRMHISAECQNKPFSMSVCFNILLAFSNNTWKIVEPQVCRKQSYIYLTRGYFFSNPCLEADGFSDEKHYTSYLNLTYFWDLSETCLCNSNRFKWYSRENILEE